MPTNLAGSSHIDTIFIDENIWLRDPYIANFFMEMKKIGVVDDLLNLHLNKKKFVGKKDSEIFEWLIELIGNTQRVWLITRDSGIYKHVPRYFRSQVLVCKNLQEMKRKASQIGLFCIIIIILKCVNIKAEKLMAELISLLHDYIEEIICELKFT